MMAFCAGWDMERHQLQRPVASRSVPPDAHTAAWRHEVLSSGWGQTTSEDGASPAGFRRQRSYPLRMARLTLALGPGGATGAAAMHATQMASRSRWLLWQLASVWHRALHWGTAHAHRNVTTSPAVTNALRQHYSPECLRMSSASSSRTSWNARTLRGRRVWKHVQSIPQLPAATVAMTMKPSDQYNRSASHSKSGMPSLPGWWCGMRTTRMARQMLLLDWDGIGLTVCEPHVRGVNIWPIAWRRWAPHCMMSKLRVGTNVYYGIEMPTMGKDNKLEHRYSFPSLLHRSAALRMASPMRSDAIGPYVLRTR